MIDVRCEKCGEDFQVPDSQAGELEECPTCKSVIAVPHGDAETAPPACATYSTQPPGAASGELGGGPTFTPQKSRKLLALAIGGVVTALLVGTVIFVLTRPSDYKVEARRTVTAAEELLRSCEAGVITFGEFDEHQRAIERSAERLKTMQYKGGGTSRVGFEGSIMVLCSQIRFLHSMKFLDEEVARFHSGGISPAFRARIGTNDIAQLRGPVADMRRECEELQ